MFRRGVAAALCAFLVGCGGGGGSSEGSLDGPGAGAGPQDPGTPGAKGQPAGLFVSRAGLERIRELAASPGEPFASNLDTLLGRAGAALESGPDPFRVDNVRALRFGWCEAVDAVDDTLKELTKKLERQSDSMRSLALAYAVTGDPVYGDAAVDWLLAWALEGDLVNLHDLNVDFAAASFDGMTKDGGCGVRPWNYALDAMWQAYGLINAADAYLLLDLNGYSLSAADEAAVREWLRELAEAVNSSFQAWTRWADANPSSSSYERYRSDNHLSWSLAGLVAAAAALGDAELGAYCLEGGSWEDRRGGAYSNPSHIEAVIDRAIEPSGRLFEERIGRDPPIGYSLFHLWPMGLVARAAELHFERDVWSYRGSDGAGLEQAYDRYAGYVLGQKSSPDPAESDLSSHRWQWELAQTRWSKPLFAEVVASKPRDVFIIQSLGPVTLVVGIDGDTLEPPVEKPPAEEPPAEEPPVEEPPVEEPPAEGPDAPFTEVASISQFGITWSFDGVYTAGRFANGDWWVVGPLNVVGISPRSTSGSRVKHGSMLNPTPRQGNTQGYDSSMDRVSYSNSLNVALDVSSSKPLRLPPGSSLVSTISIDQAANRPQLRSAAVLTVLDRIPPQGSFRPPYCGTDKTVRFTKDDLDDSLLRRLSPVGATPSLSSVERYFERPWIDHVPGWTGRHQHPTENMPDYGREMSDRVGIGALMLHLDFSDAQKERLLVRYVQLGIDLFGIVQNGGQDNWTPNGGHASGRKWPILFAGLVLGHDPMRRIGDDRATLFGEDAQTFYVERTGSTYNHGHGGYGSGDVGLPEWGIRHATSIQMDDKDWGASYRQCCTANVWGGFVLAAHIMGAKGLWKHDALFDYQDRYMAREPSGDFRCWSRFTEEMWDRYRPGYGGVWKP